MLRIHMELWDGDDILQQVDSFLEDEVLARDVFTQSHALANYTRFSDDEQIEARVITPNDPKDVKRDKIPGLVTPKVPSHVEAEKKMKKGGIDEFGIDE